MPYLVDGHNLIGALRTISLSDPDDEAKLVELLGRFAMRRNLRVVVFFDRGMPGGSLQARGGVAVQFARNPADADALITRQLRRLVSPHEWILISSDRALLAVAEEVGARTMRSHDFRRTLEALDEPSPFDSTRAEAHAFVRSDHVAEWLDVFGVDAEEAGRPVDLRHQPQPRPLRSHKPPPPSRRARTEIEPPVASAEPTPREADGRVRRSRGGPHPVSSEGERLLKPPPPVHPDEIDEWMRFFGAEEE